MALGTANNPWAEVEFDVDAVLLLSLHPDVAPEAARQLVWDRLAEHGIYRPDLEALTRAIRIHYEGGFHVDVIVARECGTGLEITAADQWERTNPKGFAVWFETRCALIGRATGVGASVEPIPAAVPTDAKPPLKLVVQLWKRTRDLYYQGRDCPASMLLTTIAAAAYPGTASLFDGLASSVAAASQLDYGQRGSVGGEPIKSRREPGSGPRGP